MSNSIKKEKSNMDTYYKITTYYEDKGITLKSLLEDMYLIYIKSIKNNWIIIFIDYIFIIIYNQFKLFEVIVRKTI